MRVTTITVLALLCFSSAAFAQVKKWVDEKGVTHFEAQGTGQPAKPPTDSKDAATKTKIAIERTHAGQRLGDNDSSYRSSRRWISQRREQTGADIYLEWNGTALTGLAVFFVDQRLAMIKITYTENDLGGWAKAIERTAEKYGPPQTNGYSIAQWTDDHTVLKLEKKFGSGVDALISDVELMRLYQSRAGNAAPKF